VDQVNYSIKFIKKILNGDATTVEVKREAEEAYTTDVQRALKDTVWMNGGCSSWYFDSNRWNATGYARPSTYLTSSLRNLASELLLTIARVVSSSVLCDICTPVPDLHSSATCNADICFV